MRVSDKGCGLHCTRVQPKPQVISEETVRINDHIVGLYNVIRRRASAEAVVRDVVLETEGRTTNVLLQEDR